MNLINIHTHRASNNALSIQNVKGNFDEIPFSGFYSAGIHPWYINSNSVAVEFEKLKKACAANNILAIGECGLDKVCETEIGLQVDVFSKQIHLANEIKKPLIIHCVRAYSEVLQLLKDKALGPVIFHGFNKNAEVAKKILGQDHYLSFGNALKNGSVAAVFEKTPDEKIFLETDDANVEIDHIYEMAAQIKKLKVDSLKIKISQNARSVFGSNFVTYDE